MFTRTAKNRERKLGEKLNDLTQSLPAEFLGDSRLWKSLIKTRRQRNSQGIPQNSCERTQKFRHFSDNWSRCWLPCWGGALYTSYNEMAFDRWAGVYLLYIKTCRHWYHHQQLKQKEPRITVRLVHLLILISITPNTSWHQWIVGGNTILLWRTNSCTVLWCL